MTRDRRRPPPGQSQQQPPQPPARGGYGYEHTSMPRPFDYERVANLVARAIEPLAKQVAGIDDKVDQLTTDHATRVDLEQLRQEVKAGLADIKSDTYSKSEIDLTLRPLRDQLQEHTDILKALQQQNATATERWLTRAGAILGLLYFIFQLGPHLLKALGG